MITIYPLDGGRILKNLLYYCFDFKRVLNIVNFVSNVSLIIITFISSIGILYFKNVSIVIFDLYLWYLVFVENRRKGIIDRMYRVLEKEGLEN